jgi:FemAB-related protein (PEP-CTERM system-associated)
VVDGGALRVRGLEPADYARWNAFVDACPEASFFHRAQWRDLIEQLGHRTHYLVAETAGRIEAILPLARVKSRLFGDHLVSSPFCVYGGVAGTSETARRVLEEAACELATSLGVEALELRNRARRHEGWPVKDLYVSFTKNIDPDPGVNLKAIPRKQRAMVRKGIEAGLCGEWSDDVDRFYRIYAESLRNLGTPVLGRGYFARLMELFGPRCRLLLVRHAGQDIAAVMSFYFRDQSLPYYGGSIPVAREVKGNDFMYWELMRRSAEEGIKIFDYGRSKQGTGSFSFKKNWGFEPQPLCYEYFLVRAKTVPEVNPLNPKYQAFIRAWKRLPLTVANRIGPWLARDLG